MSEGLLNEKAKLLAIGASQYRLLVRLAESYWVPSPPSALVKYQRMQQPDQTPVFDPARILDPGDLIARPDVEETDLVLAVVVRNY